MKREQGATLLEIIISMLIIGMVASGILTAFVFSRRMTHRSGSELTAANLVSETQAQLRATLQTPISDLTLAAGIYVDQNMVDPPPGATPLAALNFPAEFQRFQTAGRPNTGAAASVTNHGDGRMCVVEAAADLDGDGFAGVDVDPVPNGIDLQRVRIQAQWTTPNVQ